MERKADVPINVPQQQKLQNQGAGEVGLMASSALVTAVRVIPERIRVRCDEYSTEYNSRWIIDNIVCDSQSRADVVNTVAFKILIASTSTLPAYPEMPKVPHDPNPERRKARKIPETLGRQVNVLSMDDAFLIPEAINDLQGKLATLERLYHDYEISISSLFRKDYRRVTKSRTEAIIPLNNPNLYCMVNLCDRLKALCEEAKVVPSPHSFTEKLLENAVKRELVTNASSAVKSETVKTITTAKAKITGDAMRAIQDIATSVHAAEKLLNHVFLPALSRLGAWVEERENVRFRALFYNETLAPILEKARFIYRQSLH